MNPATGKKSTFQHCFSAPPYATPPYLHAAGLDGAFGPKAQAVTVSATREGRKPQLEAREAARVSQGTTHGSGRWPGRRSRPRPSPTSGCQSRSTLQGISASSAGHALGSPERRPRCTPPRGPPLSAVAAGRCAPGVRRGTQGGFSWTLAASAARRTGSGGRREALPRTARDGRYRDFRTGSG